MFIPLDSHLYEQEVSIPCVSTSLTIPGPAGDLEAITSFPVEAGATRAAGVICHPHPLYGGAMTNKVVHYISRAFNDLGVGTVRFNFRGVGASAGSYGHGAGETEDLLAVLEWVGEQYPGRPVWLAGFSFGAYVAIRGARHSAVARLVTVAPPVNLFDLNSTPEPECPWLLIQGEEDEIVPSANVIGWARNLPHPPRIIRMKGCGHFFHGRLNDLRAVLMGVLAPPEKGVTRSGGTKVA